MVNGLIATTRRFWLWLGVAALFVACFTAMPGATGDTSLALLHGLCAQTPSHSFTFGGQLLPFDGRMTGIYGGAIATLGAVFARRRLLFYGNPPWSVIVVLGAGVALMAVDGFNSLFTDLQIWHPYESRNELRVITGWFTGVALGVGLCWLLGSSLWRMSGGEPGVRSLGDLALPYLLLVPWLIVVTSGWEPLYLPVTWLLVGAAWITISLLALVALLLLFRYEDRIEAAIQLHVPGAVAALVALAIMLTLAGGRFWLERSLGFPMPV